MIDLPRFVFEVVACALLAIMLWAACAGVGYYLDWEDTSPQSRWERLMLCRRLARSS